GPHLHTVRDGHRPARRLVQPAAGRRSRHRGGHGPGHRARGGTGGHRDHRGRRRRIGDDGRPGQPKDPRRDLGHGGDGRQPRAPPGHPAPVGCHLGLHAAGLARQRGRPGRRLHVQRGGAGHHRRGLLLRVHL
ncbi:MAG: hypothetical protein AVDCRST_MAG76-245, partial [uncultured Acidimicrobiales bacterium]